MIEGAMTGDPSLAAPAAAAKLPERSLKGAAARALAEATVRRSGIDARVAGMLPEHGARRRREPVRYGDWENRGLASDF
jgi:hypothetical protein